MRFEGDSLESAKVMKQWNVKIISVGIVLLDLCVFQHTIQNQFHKAYCQYILEAYQALGPIYLYFTYLYCTHYFAYIKAVPCISLFTEYIIQSYFAHFQSLFSLSLLILNMVSETLSCGLHEAKSGIPPLLRVHSLFLEIANPLAVFAFLGILISESLFDSRTTPLDGSHQDLSIATRIGWIRPRMCPYALLKVSGSPATGACAFICALSHLLCHVSPSDVTLTSALVTSAQ